MAEVSINLLLPRGKILGANMLNIQQCNVLDGLLVYICIMPFYLLMTLDVLKGYAIYRIIMCDGTGYFAA